MNYVSVVVCILAIFAPHELFADELWRVIHITDGDTIVARRGDTIERVRLVGIDAPERARNGSVAQCYSWEARDELRKLVFGKDILLTRDAVSKNRDTYGRLLRLLYLSSLDSVSINERLVASGSVKAYTRFGFRDARRFSEKQKKAQLKKLGLWSPNKCTKSSRK